MIVDTGASRSAIAEESARLLGVPVETLRRTAGGGATGAAMIPTLPSIFLKIGDALLTMIPINDVSVLVAGPRLNLLGMDVLEGLGARVFLDLAAERGRIEWP
jgi:predicted aspartyl protease